MAKKYITVAEAIKQGSGEVHLRGWVHRSRSSNKFVFFYVRDETNIIQCVVKKDNNPEIYNEAAKLTIESSLKLSGEIKEFAYWKMILSMTLYTSLLSFVKP